MELPINFDTTTLANGNFYQTSLNINILEDFTSYKKQNVSGNGYYALQTRSNTTKFNDSTFFTITYNTNNNGLGTQIFKNKIWLFKNTFTNVHGRNSANFVIFNDGIPNFPFNYLEINYIPGIINCTYNSSNVQLFNLNCSFNYPCNCTE